MQIGADDCRSSALARRLAVYLGGCILQTIGCRILSKDLILIGRHRLHERDDYLCPELTKQCRSATPLREIARLSVWAFYRCLVLLAFFALVGCSPTSGNAPTPEVSPSSPANVSQFSQVTTEPNASCLSSGDQQDINARLVGVGKIAVLCQGSVFELSGPIEFTADGQQLFTEGFPRDDRRAVLRLVSRKGTVAVMMADRSNVVLSNVIVDGNRPNLGATEGQALIQAGGSASGQVIREVKALDTRSWSTIHLFEGGSPRCVGALVEHNEIGPAGQPDGTWADGISLACTKSIVRNNTIVDATDGGIVVFGAPGSVVESNVIRAQSRTLLGGINMVDFQPFEGDYTGTIVRGNTIDAAGATIRIGLGMGLRVWICLDPAQYPAQPTLFGAVVTGNALTGMHMQYGYTVDGVRDWTVRGNMDLAAHSGIPTVDCHGQIASIPSGFLFHKARAAGDFQSEFRVANLELALWAIELPSP